MGVVRLRRRYNPRTREMEDAPLVSPRSPALHFIWDDLPAYRSPVDGRVIDGRKQRREDLKRTHCRPYEGREQELKEAARRRAYADQKLEVAIDRIAREAWRDAPTRVRRILGDP